MEKYKFGGVNNIPRNETWETLLWSADNDFISSLILWYSNITPGSTYVWMLPHTIEKYLKSYRLKYELDINKKKKIGENGHSLIDLWTEYKKTNPIITTKPELNESFENIINDLTTIKTNIRYTGSINYSSGALLYFYIVLSSLLRYDIIGKQEYRNSFYGLCESHFGSMIYDQTCQSYGEMIVKRMLHLSLEHACSFTNMGFVNCQK